MRRICKLFIFIYFLFISNTAFAYNIAVWNSSASQDNSALSLKVSNNKVYKLTKHNIYVLNKSVYPILVFTEYNDIDEKIFARLEAYVKTGGKMILVLPKNEAEEEYFIKLAKLVGVKVNKIVALKDGSEINWVDRTLSQNTLPQYSKIAKVSLGNNTEHLAVFGELERHESAISFNRSGSVISWVWKQSGTPFFNEKSMLYLFEELMPRGSIVEVSNKDEEEEINMPSISEVLRLREIREYINKYQDIPTNYGVDISAAQENLELSKIYEFWALYYLARNNAKDYQKYMDLAKAQAGFGVLGLKDTSGVENRGIWFDRGTITEIKSRNQMAKYFDKLYKSGINTVYFETLNAGYTVYPSEIATQNPLTKGKDPLSWAVEEAHKRGMKIHAWVWIFAAGNDRHNKIINKHLDYEGPILEKHPDWALLGEEGNMRPKNQPEFWIDPSNRVGVDYLIGIISEISEKYNVDGIQLDYIRYPFQSSDNLMGFNHNSAEEFAIKTGEKVFEDNFQTNLLWNRWKENNINSFVYKAYKETKKFKPQAKVSAAIFTKSEQSRLSSIQQNWESWAQNGYIDILAPMSYSMSVGALNTNLAPLKTQISTCQIYPGVALQHVDAASMIQQTCKIRENGYPGVSFFAVAQFTPEKSDVMQSGLFAPNAVDPTYFTVSGAIKLLEEYKYFLNNITLANSDLTKIQKQNISGLVSVANETIAFINRKKMQDALDKITQLQKQNLLFFKDYSVNNGLKKQTAVSYLSKAENLMKISLREQH